MKPETPGSGGDGASTIIGFENVGLLRLRLRERESREDRLVLELEAPLKVRVSLLLEVSFSSATGECRRLFFERRRRREPPDEL